MGVFGDIQEMMNNRLAYKLWLVTDDTDRLVFSDKRYLTFVRIMMLVFGLFPLGIIAFLSFKNEDIPLPVYLILGFFSLAFLLTFLLKSISHKEAEMTKFDKKIVIRKKRFQSVLKEDSFNFTEVKKIYLHSVSRREYKQGKGSTTRSHLEIILEFNNNKDIVFSAINDPGSANALANKIALFIGIKVSE